MRLLDKLEDKIARIKASEVFHKTTDEEVLTEIIKELYGHSKGDLLPAFIAIDKLAKEEAKAERQLMYRGVEDMIGNFSMVSMHLLEGKTSRQAKDRVKYLTLNEEGNIAHMIAAMKAYFPDGKVNGASNAGTWYFNKFKDLLLKNKSKYLKGGSSYNWAIDYEHFEYIKLFIDENEK